MLLRRMRMSGLWGVLRRRDRRFVQPAGVEILRCCHFDSPDDVAVFVVSRISDDLLCSCSETEECGCERRRECRSSAEDLGPRDGRMSCAGGIKFIRLV